MLEFTLNSRELVVCATTPSLGEVRGGPRLRTFLRRSNASGARGWGVLSGWMTRHQTTYVAVNTLFNTSSRPQTQGRGGVGGMLTERELPVFLLDLFCARLLADVEDLIRTARGADGEQRERGGRYEYGQQ